MQTNFRLQYSTDTNRKNPPISVISYNNIVKIL